MKFCPSTNGFYLDSIHGASIPSDAVIITDAAYRALLDGQSLGKRIATGPDGFPVLLEPDAPSTEQIIAQYEAALDAHLDSVAHAHRYKDRFSFALRAGYPGPYHDEGAAFAAWMDTCNAQAFALLQSVQSGAAELPTIEAFISSLPEFVL